MGGVVFNGAVVVDGLNSTAGAALEVVVRLVGFAAITAAGALLGAVANVLPLALRPAGLAGEASTIRIGVSFEGPLALSGSRTGVATAGVVVARAAGISVRIVPSGSVTVGGASAAGADAAGAAPLMVGVAAGG